MQWPHLESNPPPSSLRIIWMLGPRCNVPTAKCPCCICPTWTPFAIMSPGVFTVHWERTNVRAYSHRITVRWRLHQRSRETRYRWRGQDITLHSTHGEGYWRRLNSNWREIIIMNKKFSEESIAYFPWYGTGHIENDSSNNFSVFTCLFVTAATFLLSRCLATKGKYFTEPLPSNDRGFLPSRCLATIRGYTYRQTDWRDF
jgi:hypothetical protein